MISFSIYFHYWYLKPKIIYAPNLKETIIQWLCFEIDIDWC